MGARLGKSGGGLIWQTLLVFGTIIGSIPIVFVLCMVFVAVWLWNVLVLDKLYSRKLSEKEAELAAAEDSSGDDVAGEPILDAT